MFEMKETVSNYYEKNPLGPTGRIQGIVWLGQCKEVKNSKLDYSPHKMRHVYDTGLSNIKRPTFSNLNAAWQEKMFESNYSLSSNFSARPAGIQEWKNPEMASSRNSYKSSADKYSVISSQFGPSSGTRKGRRTTVHSSNFYNNFGGSLRRNGRRQISVQPLDSLNSSNNLAHMKVPNDHTAMVGGVSPMNLRHSRSLHQNTTRTQLYGQVNNSYYNPISDGLERTSDPIRMPFYRELAVSASRGSAGYSFSNTRTSSLRARPKRQDSTVTNCQTSPPTLANICQNPLMERRRSSLISNFDPSVCGSMSIISENLVKVPNPQELDHELQHLEEKWVNLAKNEDTPRENLLSIDSSIDEVRESKISSLGDNLP